MRRAAPRRERDVRLPKFAKVSPIGAPCHAAVAVSRMRNEDSKIRGRRAMVGSTHPAPHDARHATCGESMHGSIRVFHRFVIHRHARIASCVSVMRARCVDAHVEVASSACGLVFIARNFARVVASAHRFFFVHALSHRC
ncbi:hypothetical protein [Ralstonia solanacearum]|uniref:hypothetical protein n=1 Tax=Ralstonia solanacearum TaxID=305 RepID=UPI0012D439C8|nr:hypothetical protein [Ralstonia solanacearum]MDC6177255.1 hypothetical protein [Ralstonia solanacearum]MDC6210186.1 hypothetical protein [Ralstonia solanacearum]MDC6237836.1 hypothetical protein [Ralstonia solanacearum]MDD7799552.1 hypothetical protein [Ralstonia solanacearum]